MLRPLNSNVVAVLAVLCLPHSTAQFIFIGVSPCAVNNRYFLMPVINNAFYAFAFILLGKAARVKRGSVPVINTYNTYIFFRRL